jgi:F0F1-type ATP synthase membrane subunit b/b'
MLDKILKTIKKYWYMFAILALTIFVLFVSFAENAKVAGLTNMIKKVTDGYKKQFDKIEELNDKKTEKDKKTITEAEKNAEEIEAKKQQEIQKALEDKQKSIDELKKKTAQELADKMKDEFKL